mmetsp:Transcript_53054/g.128743  ORF Transcript_53054/g.128743 Transcript_53054/m.128743 type:complete len:229 (+) Transcript_53054:2342-3028(+)
MLMSLRVESIISMYSSTRSSGGKVIFLDASTSNVVRVDIAAASAASSIVDSSVMLTSILLLVISVVTVSVVVYSKSGFGRRCNTSFSQIKVCRLACPSWMSLSISLTRSIRLFSSWISSGVFCGTSFSWRPSVVCALTSSSVVCSELSTSLSFRRNKPPNKPFRLLPRDCSSSIALARRTPSLALSIAAIRFRITFCLSVSSASFISIFVTVVCTSTSCGTGFPLRTP